MHYYVCFRIASDYEAHAVKALEDPLKHLGNPVNAFLLVKRFTADWKKVKEMINSPVSESKFCF